MTNTAGRLVIALSCSIAMNAGLSAFAEAQCATHEECGNGFVCVDGQCVAGRVIQQPQPAQPQAQVQVQVQPAPVPYAQPGVYVQPTYAPQPAGPTRYEERSTMGLLVPGVVLLAVGWAIDIFVSLVGGAVMQIDATSTEVDTAQTFMYTSLIPLIGPWVQMGVIHDDSWTPYLVIDGLVQAAGLTMLILGAVIKQRVEVRAELGRDLMLGVMPFASPSAAGLNASLTF